MCTSQAGVEALADAFTSLMRYPKVISAVAVSLLVLMVAAGVFAQPVSYTTGHSIGPLAPVADPILDEDLRTYAVAWWQFIDSGGDNQTLLEAFDPQSQHWVVDDESPGSHIAPFADGYALFRSIYAHKLALDPTVDDIIDIDTLVETDAGVAATWRHWTLHRQLTTSTTADATAHARHLAAIQEALTTGQDWSIIGVPNYSGASLHTSASVTSDRLTKQGPAWGDYSPPDVLDVTTLGTCAFSMQTRIDNAKDILTGYNGPPDSAKLYQPDKQSNEVGGPKSGFDCDDFAYAMACYITKSECCTNCEPGCLQAKTLYLNWTKKANGVPKGHLIVKIICCGRYWLIDPQTGNVSGPHAGNTIPNGYELVKDSYGIDLSIGVTTLSTEHDIGERSGTEPPPWDEDQDAIDHFERVTQMDAADFSR